MVQVYVCFCFENLLGCRVPDIVNIYTVATGYFLKLGTSKLVIPRQISVCRGLLSLILDHC